MREQQTFIQQNLLSLEADVIGSILANPALFEQARGLLIPDFTSPDHQNLWRFILNAISHSTPLTVSVAARAVPLSDPQIPDRIASTASKNADTVGHNAALIVDHVRKQHLSRILGNGISEIADQKTPWHVTAQTLVRNILAVSGTGRARPADQTRHDLKQRLATRKAHHVPTGLRALDNALGGGMPRSSHIMVGAFAKTGKTTLVATISANLEQQGILHAVVLLERDATQIEALKAGRALGCNANNLGNNLDALDSLPPEQRHCIYIAEPAISIEALRHELLYLKRRYNIGAILIDQWQLIGEKPPRETLDAYRSRTARTIQQTAIDAEVPILTTYQLSEGSFIRDASANIASAWSSLNIELNRDRGEAEAWMKIIATNITDETDIGSITTPQFILDRDNGPHFRDITG